MRRLISGRFTGGGRLRESNHRGFLPRRSLNTSTLRKAIYCMQFPSYDMCSSILLLKFFLYSKKDSAHRDNKKAEKSLKGLCQLESMRVEVIQITFNCHNSIVFNA